MKLKVKVIFVMPLLMIRILSAKRMARKIRNWKGDDDRYSQAWRNTYVLKKSKRMAKNLNLKINVIGFNNLPKAPAILVPNHASSFDPALILIALEQKSKESEKPNYEPNFLAKEDLKSKKTMFLAFLNILNTHYVSRVNPRKALRVMDEFSKFIKENHKLGIIFAEGTRTKSGKINQFEVGAFHLAKKSFLPIVPVTINNSWGINNYSRTGKLEVEVIFHKPLKPINFISSDKKYLAQKVHDIVNAAYTKPTVKANLSKEGKLA